VRGPVGATPPIDSPSASSTREFGTAPSRVPIVTIGMPVYNGARYVEEAVRSLLKQTEDDFILLISDNCSTDATPEICARLSAEDPRITYVKQEENIGATRNFEYVLRAAQTPFFMWAAHDDLWAPTFLATCIELLQGSPDAAASSVGVRIVDEAGHETGHLFPPPGLMSSRRLARVRAANRDGYMAMYGVLRRDALPEKVRVGDFAGSADAFVFAIALNRRIVTTDEILFTYRVVNPTTKRRGTEAHLYDDSHIPSGMYRSMMRDIGGATASFGTKARLRIYVVGRWLASARWANVRESRRAWDSRNYGSAALRLPPRLLLGVSRGVYIAIARLLRHLAGANEQTTDSRSGRR
jgi:glycosyltransferase involved in cell wall biosynthesis